MLDPVTPDVRPTRLVHPEGNVYVGQLNGGRREVRVELSERCQSVSPRLSIMTALPVALIEMILEVKGPAYLCDEIARDEDPTYVSTALTRELLAFVDSDSMAGKEILDFGCGAGASSIILERVFSTAKRIIATDFNAEYLKLARARRDFYGADRIDFQQQPDPTSLPLDLPMVDLVVLSAVVEHMLPDERRTVLPKIWERIRVGGRLFISDTPHRWFPKEAHTTFLWFLNYQADERARRRTIAHGQTGLTEWKDMLRAGIRGSTEHEIIDCLTGGNAEHAQIVVPSGPGIRSRADLWYQGLTRGRFELPKKALRVAIDVGERLTGSLLTQNITLCVERRA